MKEANARNGNENCKLQSLLCLWRRQEASGREISKGLMDDKESQLKHS